MSEKFQFHFSGYATKNNIKCSDGRIIMKDAFKHNDGLKVPLVWQHMHNSPDNVLGHAILENREDGVYCYGVLNSTDAGQNAKELVKHGDVGCLSIHANELTQNGSNVLHGNIREVSLVLSGANPGAKIDNLSFEHADGSISNDETEAIVCFGEKIETKEEVNHASETSDSGKTMKDVFNTLNEEQKTVVYAMLADVMLDGGSATQSSEGETFDQKNGGKEEMKRNVFESKDNKKDNQKELTHSDIQTIMENAKKCGSFKDAFISHAATYGIENIDYLFPDAKTLQNDPDFIKRQTEWVAGVISGTKHVPFSRIKSLAADITADEARALGYVKGSLKKEEVIGLLRRVTTPTTIYKKQKLDRDDIIDITDLDVVAWLKAEMRMLLDEELARAVLVGDGRDSESQDKITEANIRPIYTDDDMYSHHVSVESDKDTTEIIEAIIRARVNYKGSGNPTLYVSPTILTDMLLLTDSLGRRLYPTVTELASVLRVSNIVEVPILEGLSREVDETELNLICIIVNLNDYVMGADKGGNISMFDDFDIDYNQYKYLIETRCSGTLTKPKSALVIEQIVAGD